MLYIRSKSEVMAFFHFHGQTHISTSRGGLGGAHFKKFALSTAPRDAAFYEFAVVMTMRTRTAVALILALVTLRMSERLQAILSGPSGVSTFDFEPAVAMFMPAERQTVSEPIYSGYPLIGRPLHARPLKSDEAATIWQPHIGNWLSNNVGRKMGRAAPPAVRGCPGGCGTDGTCDAMLGVCRCVSGRTGAHCERDEHYRCNADDGRYLWSRCAGECDTRHGYCYCGSRGTYPDRPLLQCEPIGIEKEVAPWKVEPRNAAERYPWAAIWGKSATPGKTGAKAGWCDANASTWELPIAKCACRYDGRDGYLCQHEVAMFCLNQCSFRGRCVHGFCVCAAGWWGVDCSIPADDNSATAASADIDPEDPLGVAQLGLTDAAASENSAAAELAAPSAATPPLRPLIYVYEMPPAFTTDQLVRRHDKMFCAHRTYLKGNKSQYAYGIYQGYVLEVILHEWLLSSPHRTLDPSKADWFYVPVYGSCAMVTAIFTTPNTIFPKYRTALASKLYAGAYEHIKTQWPYWNASGGKDHIWTFGYDEGGCFAPAPLWPSMIISHWGNTMSKHNRCTTTYDADRWDPPFDPPTKLPLSSLIGSHPCYDPQKDLIMPSFRELTTFLPKDLTRRELPRKALFFFSGDLGSPKGAVNAGPHVSPNYSLGIRQAVYRSALAANAEDVKVVGHFQKDYWHVKYHGAMHNATFCGAFPGDGWSGGISSAVFAGCVPVIVMDGIEMPFENVLHYPSFSVRIKEADVPRLPEILRSIPKQKVEQLQAGLSLVRSRFGYASLAINELRLAKGHGVEPHDYLGKLEEHNARREDALDTVMRVLLYRAAKRKGEVKS